MHGPIDEVYRRIRGNRIVEIKFLDKMQEGLSLIRSKAYTRNVLVEDHRASVELATTDAEAAQLLAELTRAGVKMSSFAEKDPTLEDVFMLVTKGLVI
jgi:ABC-2 type transport system ATP-binding protein